MLQSLEQNLSSCGIRRTTHFSNNLSDVRSELRQRRKSFLQSNISTCALVSTDDTINKELIEDLSHHLAKRAAALWENKPVDAESFCFRFFKLTITGLTSDKLTRECVDDIIQLAECLVRSRKIFSIATKTILPGDMIGELFDFTESYDDSFYSSTFEDAVLGAIAVLLGVLTDPIDNNTNKEASI